jgi:hypothetical protein
MDGEGEVCSEITGVEDEAPSARFFFSAASFRRVSCVFFISPEIKRNTLVNSHEETKIYEETINV